MRAKGAWRVQVGSRVRYSSDRRAGYAHVLKILQEDGVGTVGQYIVVDEEDGELITIYGNKMEFTPKRIRRIKQHLYKK